MTDRYLWKPGDIKVLSSSQGYAPFVEINSERRFERYPFYRYLSNEDYGYGGEIAARAISEFLTANKVTKSEANVYLAHFAEACRKFIAPNVRLTQELCLYAKALFLDALEKKGIRYSDQEWSQMLQ